MSLHTYAKNIRYHVEEILEQFDFESIDEIVPVLKNFSNGELEQSINRKHNYLLEFISKTPKQRIKLEQLHGGYTNTIRTFSLYELQKVALFIERLDAFLLNPPSPYRNFEVHTSKFLQELSCDNVLDALKITIDDFKRSKVAVLDLNDFL